VQQDREAVRRARTHQSTMSSMSIAPEVGELQAGLLAAVSEYFSDVYEPAGIVSIATLFTPKYRKLPFHKSDTDREATQNAALDLLAHTMALAERVNAHIRNMASMQLKI
jgi:hypothetical protein